MVVTVPGLGPVAKSLAHVAAIASTCYELMMQSATENVLRFGTIDQVKSFQEGMGLLHDLSKADQEYQAKVSEGKPLSPQVRCGRGGAAYSIKQIFEHMSLGINLRSQKRMSFVIDAAYHLTCGTFSDFLFSVSDDGVRRKRNSGSGMSAATLSRARYRLDVFLMLLRRQQWKNWRQQAEQALQAEMGAEGCHAFPACRDSMVLSIGFDSTPQRLDLFMVEEFSTKLAEAFSDWKDESMNAKTVRRPFPMVSLGKGSSNFPSKLDALMCTIKLECLDVHEYSRQVISMCSDQGTEFKLNLAPRLSLKAVEQDWMQLLDSTSSTAPVPVCNLVPVAGDANAPWCDEADATDLGNHDAEAADGADAVFLDDARQFPNAFRVAGVLHISDNVLGNLLECTSIWQPLLGKLKTVEILLGRPHYRERFAHFCLADAASKRKLETWWSPGLKGLRWQAILKFTSALLPLEGILRRHWNKEAFSGDATLSGTTSENFGVIVRELDSVLTDAAFWGHVHMICDLAEEANSTAEWAERCPCHDRDVEAVEEDEVSSQLEALQTLCPGPVPLAASCPRRGCRAPELATGHALRRQREELLSDKDRILFHTSGMAHEDQCSLLQDWLAARARLWSEVYGKLSYWQRLPHLVCGLAANDPIEIRDTAQKILRQYDELLSDCEHTEPWHPAQHAMTRRFCDASWNGLDSGDEAPLRPYVERLAAGEQFETFSQHELWAIGIWLCRFRHVKVVERSTEGLHSIVKRSLLRARNATLSYLSLELRFSHLVHVCVTEPGTFMEMVDRYETMSTHTGFAEAVLQLLNVKQQNISLQLQSLPDRQLADLLYRDNLVLKHSPGASHIRKMLCNVTGGSNGASTSSAKQKNTDALASSIVEFLMEVCERDRMVLISCKTDFINSRLFTLEDVFSAAPTGPASVSGQALGCGQPAMAEGGVEEEEGNIVDFGQPASKDHETVTGARLPLAMVSGLPRMTELSKSEPAEVFLRLGRNVFSHMTLQWKPQQSFDCLAQIYCPCSGKCFDEHGEETPETMEIVALGSEFPCKIKDATTLQLLDNISLWSLEAVQVDAKSKSETSSLLLEMAEARAWSPQVTGIPMEDVDSCQSFFIPGSSEDAVCQKLLKDKLIVASREEPDVFFLSAKALEAMEMKLQVGSKRSLEEYHKSSGDVPVDKLCAFELFMMLVHAGWDQVDASELQSPFFAEGQDQEFCMGDRLYFLVLLQSDGLFRAGLKSIYHQQIKTYYATILHLAALGESGQQALMDLQPKKAAREYKSLMKDAEDKNSAVTASGQKRGSHAVGVPSIPDIGSWQDEGSIFDLGHRHDRPLAENSGKKTSPRLPGHRRGGGPGGRRTVKRQRKVADVDAEISESMVQESQKVELVESSSPGSSDEVEILELPAAPAQAAVAFAKRPKPKPGNLLRNIAMRQSGKALKERQLATAAPAAAPARSSKARAARDAVAADSVVDNVDIEHKQGDEREGRILPEPEPIGRFFGNENENEADASGSAPARLARPSASASAPVLAPAPDSHSVMAPASAPAGLEVAAAASGDGEGEGGEGPGHGASAGIGHGDGDQIEPARARAPQSKAKAKAKAGPKAKEEPGPNVLRRGAGEASSLFNASTVWIGDVPIVKRIDKGLGAYYVTCPCHRSSREDGKERKCKKELSVTNVRHDSLVIRMMAWWIAQGFKMVRMADETDEAFRSRHVNMAPPKKVEDIPSLDELKAEIAHHTALQGL